MKPDWHLARQSTNGSSQHQHHRSRMYSSSPTTSKNNKVVQRSASQALCRPSLYYSFWEKDELLKGPCTVLGVDVCLGILDAKSNFDQANHMDGICRRCIPAVPFFRPTEHDETTLSSEYSLSMERNNCRGEEIHKSKATKQRNDPTPAIQLDSGNIYFDKHSSANNRPDTAT